MRKRVIFIILGFLVVMAVVAVFAYFHKYHITYHTINKIEMEKSKYHDSGSWWGYNQHKLATIGSTTFSFVYDNSALDQGNSSETNPFYCYFITIKNGVVNEFFSAPVNASGNVLADSGRNIVYYIVNEPVGAANEGGLAWTGPGKIVVYAYDYYPLTNDLTLKSKETIVDAVDDGRQRMGTAINEKGQVMISYGSYDSMLNVFIYDPIGSSWASYHILSNPDQDFLMYNYAIIKDLDEFYVLAIQDTAKNNQNYYQYVKFFRYKNGAWTEKMVVDYRDTEEALTEANLIEHTEFTLIGEEIHILTRSYFFNKINYFIWTNEQLTESNIDFINTKADWVRIVKTEDDLLFVYNYDSLFGSQLAIYSKNYQKIVYHDRDFIEGAYVYVNLKEGTVIQVYGICGKDKIYHDTKAFLYEISK